MLKYSYKAKDDQGKTIKGLVEAKDAKGAVAVIKAQGLLVISLREIKELETKKTLIRFFQRITTADLATFTRQLSTMITAGLSLPDALEILRDQTKPAFALVLKDILRSIEEGGVSLTEALQKHERVFGKVYISLIKAGETAGVLDEVLARLADNLEKQKEFGSKIKGAMIYPVIIVVGMVGVMVIMMVFVLPKIMTMFSEFGTELPLPTRVLIAVSNLMTHFWWAGILGGIGLVFGWRSVSKTGVGRKRIDTLKLKLPILGNLQKQVALTEMVRTLALLVKTGIPLVEALNIIGEGMNNVVFQEGLLSAAGQVEKGFPLAAALAEHENFPPILTQMISVGEETGKLDEVLFRVSSYFESESEHTVKGLTTAIEPLIMVVLGIGVAFLVMSVIMPMYSLTSQF